MDSIQHERPIEPMRIAPEIRPHVQDVMAKMLAKSPEDRFSSAAEVLEALERECVEPDGSSITRKLFRALLLKKPTWR
jgi:serine/threonine protein kinase